MKVVLKELDKNISSEGFMVPIYKDYETWHLGHVPEMAYMSVMVGNTFKGPILHLKRKSYLTAIGGKIELQFSENNLTVEKVYLNNGYNSFVAAVIEPGVPIAFKNYSNENGIIFNIPSPAWREDDQDTYRFISWIDYFNKIGTFNAKSFKR